MNGTTRLTYEVYETEQHGYKFTHVVVRTMYENDTRKRLEGTVDNKDGYGTEGAARKMGRLYGRLLEEGHEVYYDTMSYGGLHVHLEWQHYDGGTDDPRYCEPTYRELGRRLEQIEEGLRFLRKIGRRIERREARLRHPHYRNKATNRTFRRPEDVIRALYWMKETVQVEQVEEETLWTATQAKRLPNEVAA